MDNTDTSDDVLEKMIDKYKNHSGITCINKHKTNYELTFISMCYKNYIGKLVKLFNDIPTKLIKNFVVSFLSLYRQALITV